jgi:putative iron-dependent peroxidase
MLESLPRPRFGTDMNDAQTGLLSPLPPLARYAFFELRAEADAAAALARLAALADGAQLVVGLGQPLLLALGRSLPGMKPHPALAGPGFAVPSTQDALWCWLRGDDRGELVHRARAAEQALAPAFRLVRLVDAFLHAGNRDLSGYEDGTENPQGDEARLAALVRGGELDASSFVAVEQWRHDFDAFEAMTPAARNDAIGRDRQSNEELDAAPESTHVKRTAQENFEPPAFLLRRSMPWADAHGAGLMFVAFGRSFDAFEAQLQRMCGHDDGIVDALFAFTRPIAGGYFWCPPLRDGRLDLSAAGL